jgi:hypothetical protein
MFPTLDAPTAYWGELAKGKEFLLERFDGSGLVL